MNSYTNRTALGAIWGSVSCVHVDDWSQGSNHQLSSHWTATLPPEPQPTLKSLEKVQMHKAECYINSFKELFHPIIKSMSSSVVLPLSGE